MPYSRCIEGYFFLLTRRRSDIYRFTAKIRGVASAPRGEGFRPFTFNGREHFHAGFSMRFWGEIIGKRFWREGLPLRHRPQLRLHNRFSGPHGLLQRHVGGIDEDGVRSRPEG